jgi:hypothetical protein
MKWAADGVADVSVLESTLVSPISPSDRFTIYTVSLHFYTLNLCKNQLQRLDLKMPHIQINLDLPILVGKRAMGFIPRHRFFKDIDPFGVLDFDTRSDRQLSSLSSSPEWFRYDGAEVVWEVVGGLTSQLPLVLYRRTIRASSK